MSGAIAIRATTESQVQASATSQQYLTFTLGGEIYAVETLRVKEIIEYGHLTTVPLMPPSVRGVINLRGAVVPVIDLKSKFTNEKTEIAKRTCIIIVEISNQDEQQVFGLIVDAVNEVLEISIEDIEPPPSFGASIRADFIQGMGKVAGKFVILLDLGRIVSTDEITLQAVPAEAHDTQ